MMADEETDGEEAMTKEELRAQAQDSTDAAPRPSKATAAAPPKDAFAALMAPKPRATPSSSSSPSSSSKFSRTNIFKDRMGLGVYISDPSSFPASRVIHHTDEFVVINDKFPKATIHTLLLPRSARHNLLHPFEAFADPEFLAGVRTEAEKLKVLVAKELQRRLGRYSRSDATRQAVLDGEADSTAATALPEGRDWSAEVRCGVHAVPSMGHLHVHVLSRDMSSASLKHRKHYNSFNTPFFVDLDDFPLAADDPRRDTREQGYLRWDMKCWRCGRNFGNSFSRLKEHLGKEFELWKAE